MQIENFSNNKSRLESFRHDDELSTSDMCSVWMDFNWKPSKTFLITMMSTSSESICVDRRSSKILAYHQQSLISKVENSVVETSFLDGSKKVIERHGPAVVFSLAAVLRATFFINNKFFIISSSHHRLLPSISFAFMLLDFCVLKKGKQRARERDGLDWAERKLLIHFMTWRCEFFS